MADYIDLNGAQTWYDERGTGEPVVLLHGGLSDSRDFTGNLDALADRFRLLMPERRGHGHTPDVPGPFAADALADDTAAFIEKIADGPVRLAGYSAGAVVALRTAVRRPDLVERLALISGAFDPDGMILRPSLDAPPPLPLLEAYAEVSPDGASHFGEVIAKVVRSVEEDRPLTAKELAVVTCPALVMTADDDFISFEHTIAMYRALGPTPRSSRRRSTTACPLTRRTATSSASSSPPRGSRPATPPSASTTPPRSTTARCG